MDPVSSPPFADLPTDTLSVIVGFLPTETLLVVRLVSSRFRDVVEPDTVWQGRREFELLQFLEGSEESLPTRVTKAMRLACSLGIAAVRAARFPRIFSDGCVGDTRTPALALSSPLSDDPKAVPTIMRLNTLSKAFAATQEAVTALPRAPAKSSALSRLFSKPILDRLTCEVSFFFNTLALRTCVPPIYVHNITVEETWNTQDQATTSTRWRYYVRCFHALRSTSLCINPDSEKMEETLSRLLHKCSLSAHSPGTTAVKVLQQVLTIDDLSTKGPEALRGALMYQKINTVSAEVISWLVDNVPFEYNRGHFEDALLYQYPEELLAKIRAEVPQTDLAPSNWSRNPDLLFKRDPPYSEAFIVGMLTLDQSISYEAIVCALKRNFSDESMRGLMPKCDSLLPHAPDINHLSSEDTALLRGALDRYLPPSSILGRLLHKLVTLLRGDGRPSGSKAP